jgi:hypothetical protein
MASTVELSDYEKLIYNINTLGDFNVIGIVVLEAGNIEISENMFKKAMFYMYNRHPLFRARVQKCKNKIYFKFPNDEEKFQSFDQILVQTGECEANLTEELEAFNSVLFDYEKKCLLWRATLIKYKLKQYVLALVLPFFITDGMNINALCIEIVNILNSLIAKKSCDEMQCSLNLIDNLHELVEKNKLLKLDVVEKRLKNTKNVLFNLPSKFKNHLDNGLKINLMALDKDLSKKLIQESKSRGLKITGYLFATALYALKYLYDDINFLFPKDIACGIPAKFVFVFVFIFTLFNFFLFLSLRIRLQPNIEFNHVRYCVLLTHIDLYYPRFGQFKDVWKDAEYINEVIVENTKFENGSILELSHDNEYIDLGNSLFDSFQDQKLLSNSLNSHKTFDLSLSNLGTYLYDRVKRVDGPLNITEIYHGDSINTDPNGFPSLMLHVSTWNSQIMIQLSSSRKAFAAQYSDQFMEFYKLAIEKSLYKEE